MRRKVIGTAILSLLLVLSIGISPVSAAGPSVAQQKVGITNEYPLGIFTMLITASYSTNDRQPVRESQAEHRAGATTTLSIERSVTTQSTASASLGFSGSANIEADLTSIISASFESTLAAEVGVAYSVSRTVAATVTYTLSPDVEPGLYRIVVVYPRRQVRKTVTGKNSRGTTTLWQQTVTYAPRTDDSYITWEKYTLGE